MKNIISRLIPTVFISVIIGIIGYAVEEYYETRLPENILDLIYPITGIIILLFVWLYFLPSVKQYLNNTDK